MMRTNEHARRAAALCLVTLLMLLCIVPGIARVKLTSAASPPYHVTMAASNFGQNLSAAALDFSSPQHALFSLQNGTSLWYAISMQSTPSGIALLPADTNDLVTNTFYSTAGELLPAGDVLPPGYGAGQQLTSSTPILRLAVTFAGPGEQAQITLNAYDPHATLMDVVTLLLHLLGEQSSGIEVGLLAPGVLTSIENSAQSMRYLQELAGDYAALLQSALNQSDTSGLWQAAYACARDLASLVSDTTERAQLANLLWLVMGKTIPQASIITTLSAFGTAQFGLGMLGFFKDEVLSIGGTLFQQNNPTLTLQSIANVTPTPTPSVTPTQVTPKPTPTPKLIVSPTRAVPTPTPTPKKKG